MSTELTSDPVDLAGLSVTVMGLGLHGGGAAAARFLASRGCRVTVTDLRDEATLAPSVEALADLPIRFVLGTHTEDIFRNADLVIKNPAVPPSSPYLRIARRVETDISIFLRYNSSPVIAVTGSKGKSTTASAIHHCLKEFKPGSRLGGNITVSPLTFLDEPGRNRNHPVVLELSSWQLADLRGSGLLKPCIAVLTVILPDHQDKYSGMDAYVADKKEIYRGQDRGDYTICLRDDPWGRCFHAETPGTPLYYSEKPLPPDMEGGALEEDGWGYMYIRGVKKEILPGNVRLPGRHNRLNLLSAAMACVLSGVDSSAVAASLAAFPGIEHRLEFLRTRRGVDFYNDSAATIPEATEAAVKSFERPVVLLTGGTDKNLDFAPLRAAAGTSKAVILLEGTGTAKIMGLLAKAGIAWEGPFRDLEEGVRRAASVAEAGDVLLFSPGCTSFGMFLNEFDRGRKYKALVAALSD